MPPIQKNSNFVSSETIVWEGPDIPCIELCTGDKVSNIVYKVATKLCGLADQINSLKGTKDNLGNILGGLDYGCIITTLSQVNETKDPETFSLKLLFQLLLDNDCTLKALIEQLKRVSATSSVVLTGLNLGCITHEMLNLCGIIPDVLDPLKVFQAIINILCEVQSEAADLLIRTIALETQIEALGPAGLNGYTEPSIISCLSLVDNTGNPIPVLMSTHISTITDKNICDLKKLVGTPVALNNLIQSQCLTDYVTNSSINQSATSLADVMRNKEIIICDLMTRISQIESTCCSVGCADIRLGMLQTYDATLNEFTIDFTYGAGTNIPMAFIDCGSTFVLTDWKGVTKTIPNNPGDLSATSANHFVIGLNGSGLDIVKPITIQISTCFTHYLTHLICKDCFTFILDKAATDLSNELTCWDFDVPLANTIPGQTILYKELVTSFNVNSTTGVPIPLPITNNDTSIGGIIQLPILGVHPNIIDTDVCSGPVIRIMMQGQSKIIPPVLHLFIALLGTVIAIPGTLNTGCTC